MTPEMTHIELTKEEKNLMRDVRSEYYRLTKHGKAVLQMLPGITLEDKGAKIIRTVRTAPVNPITGPGCNTGRPGNSRDHQDTSMAPTVVPAAECKPNRDVV